MDLQSNLTLTAQKFLSNLPHKSIQRAEIEMTLVASPTGSALCGWRTALRLREELQCSRIEEFLYSLSLKV